MPVGTPKDARDAVTPAQLAAAIEKLGTWTSPNAWLPPGPTRRAEPGDRRSRAAQGRRIAPGRRTCASARWSLLSGFNDPRTRDIMRGALGLQNDRLRAVAYTYFEHNARSDRRPEAARRGADESSEFVRPALTRALAAYGTDPKVREMHGRARDEGAGVLPQRGDRGARRLPRGLCGGADHRGREDRRAAADRRGASRSARSATSRRCRRSRGSSEARRASRSRPSPRRSACSA